MTTCGETGDLRQMCSLATRQGGEDPIGNAPAAEHYLLVEVATPWERNVLGSQYFPAELRSVLEEADKRSIAVKFLAMVPDESTPTGHVRLLYLQRPTGPFAAYEKLDYVVPPSALAPLARTVLWEKADLPRFESYRQHSSHIRDMLVCTHGSRDACCAKFGYPLYRTLQNEYIPNSGGRLRAWRVSHIGGHRFAPTLIDLPEARYWAHLDTEALDQIVRRTGTMPDLRRHYRGWGGLRTLHEQVAERVILQQQGWGWTEYLKWGELLPRAHPDQQEPGAITNGRVHVRIHFAAPSGEESGYYQATVEDSGETARSLGSCGDSELNESSLYTIARLERVVGHAVPPPRMPEAAVAR